MKLSTSRTCALRKSLPAAPTTRKKNKGKVSCLLKGILTGTPVPKATVAAFAGGIPEKKNKGPVKIRRPPLLINNLQRRRYESTISVQTDKPDDNCVTVADLKRLITEQQNLSVLALLFRGIPLDDTRHLSSLLPDLRIGPVRFAVHTRVRPRAIPGGVIINVLTLPRKTFQVSLPSLDSTLLELKESIQGYEGISIAEIALTCEGRQISSDDLSSLRTCNLTPNCTVVLVGRLLGGNSLNLPQLQPLAHFVDVEETSLLQKILLQPNRAPDWRVSEEGLSVEGECRNSDCKAYGQMVISNMRFAVYNLQEVVHCPLCNFEIRAVTCGFRKCLWMFEGRKVGPGNVDVASQWMTAGGTYERFDEGADRAVAGWSSLIITAKKLPSRRSMKEFHGIGECPICYEAFTAASSQCIINCQHAFHRECVVMWQMRGNSTCPMCRASIE